MTSGELSRRGLLGAAAGAAGGIALSAVPHAFAAAPDAPALPPTRDTYLLPLGRMDPTVTGSSGTLAIGSRATMPVLAGQASFAWMRVQPGGLREPHWHPDTWEIQYYVAGRGRVEVVLVTGECAQIDVEPGVAVFLPQGCGHAARNTGDGPLEAILSFQVDTPRSIGLGNFLSGMSTATSAQTLRVADAALADVPKPSRGDPFPPARTGAGLAGPPALPASAQALAFPLAAAEPADVLPGGTLSVCDANVLPALRGTDASLVLGRLQPGALREPHWHPDAWEVNVCLEGSGQVDLVLPDGTAATLPVGPGDAVFVPQGAGHAIHNLGGSDLTFVAFFNADVATTIGLSAFYGGLPTAAIAQTLRVPRSTLAPIPKPSANAVIVPPR